MHRFVISGEGVLDRDEARHAFRVLRLRPGDEVEALDGSGRRYRARIDQLDEAGGRVTPLCEMADNESPLRLTVYQGIPKAEKLELLAQKLTELGVCRLIPVRMARCVVKLDQRDAEKRAQRLARIAQEAAKQCGRAGGLEILPAMDFRAAIKDMEARSLTLVPWEEARGTRLSDLHGERPTISDLGIVIGPEGGISAEEISAMEAVGARCVTLGPRILRTETAAIAAAAACMALWGDL